MCSKFGGLTSFGSFTLSLHRHYFSCSKSCHVYEIATAAKFAAKKKNHSLHIVLVMPLLYMLPPNAHLTDNFVV